LAIGEAGAANAGLSVVAILALQDPAMKAKLIKYRADQAEKVRNSKLPELA
jgi:phosphoribosylcarboxyaminoimidazole (NCAIR) mutase